MAFYEATSAKASIRDTVEEKRRKEVLTKGTAMVKNPAENAIHH